MRMFRRRSKCDKIREMLSPYIDGRLTSWERDAVRYHVEVCEKCHRELESLKMTVELLHGLPQAPLRHSFALAEPVESRRPMPISLPTFGWLRPVAVVVLVMLVALLACDLGGLFLVQKSPVAEPGLASPPAVLPQVESPLPRVGSLAPKEGKSPEEVTPAAPFAAEKRGIPHEAEVIPQGKEGREAGQAEQPAPAVSSPTPSGVSVASAISIPLWLRPLEIALASLLGLLLSLLFLTRRKARPLKTV